MSDEDLLRGVLAAFILSCIEGCCKAMLKYCQTDVGPRRAFVVCIDQAIVLKRKFIKAVLSSVDICDVKARVYRVERSLFKIIDIGRPALKDSKRRHALFRFQPFEVRVYPNHRFILPVGTRWVVSPLRSRGTYEIFQPLRATICLYDRGVAQSFAVLTLRALARLLARQAYTSQYVPPAATGNANDNGANDNIKGQQDARRDLRQVQQRPPKR